MIWNSNMLRFFASRKTMLPRCMYSGLIKREQSRLKGHWPLVVKTIILVNIAFNDRHIKTHFKIYRRLATSFWSYKGFREKIAFENHPKDALKSWINFPLFLPNINDFNAIQHILFSLEDEIAQTDMAVPTGMTHLSS